VLIYLSWHLYVLEGLPQEHMPQDLESAGESSLLDVLDFAQRTNYFQESDFEPLKEYLLQTYPADNPEEIGAPITKEEVMAHLPQRA
jgi:hypothetical protein